MMAQNRLLHRPARGAGFTMIELMIVMVIMAVLLAVAVPSMREFVARKRVEGVAQELATDLKFLKSRQLQRNQFVGLLFNSNATNTCYSLYEIGPADNNCDCTRPPGTACPNPGNPGSSVELKTVVLPRSSGITLSSAPNLLRLFGFNASPIGNTTIQATVQSTLGGSVRVSTNALVVPVMCSVSGSWNSLPAC